MREDRKKVIWLGVILFWICVLLITNRERLNLFFSNLFVIQEENPEPLTYADEMPIDGITIGREIIQPLTFSRRVGHIGIKIGTYERENHSTYEISLVDQWGNVLGMAKEDALNMKNNEYYYIKIERLITPGQEYYLKIITDSAEEENAITCYASKSITNQKNAIVNGVEQDYSLIMTFMYGKVKEYTNGIVAVLLFSFLIYVIYQLIDGKKYLFMLKNIVLSKRMHQIVIVVLFICLLSAIFCKEMVYQILYAEEYHSNIYVSEALLDSVVVEQSFVYPEEEMDCIEVKFALFLQTFQSGVIHFELYEWGNSEVIRSSFINASDITTENISFLFPKIEDAKDKEYILKIYTTEVNSENAMSIFYTNNSSSEQTFKIHGNIVQGNIVLTAGVTHREYNWRYIIIFVLIEIGTILLYLYRFYIIKRSFVILMGMVFAIYIGGIGFKAYSIYHQFDIDGMVKVFISDYASEEKVYTRESGDYKETLDSSFRADGTCYGVIQMMELLNVNTKIDTIRIKFEGNMEKRSHNISVFFDTGKGYNNNEKCLIPYIYHGENEILLYIPNRNIVRSVRIDIGKSTDIEIVDEKQNIIDVKEIFLNESILEERNEYFLIISVFIFMLFFFYFISRAFIRKESIILVLFLVIGIVSGVIISVLIPIAQVPDEAYHVGHTLGAIGGGKVYEQLRNINTEAGVYRIAGFSGEQINIPNYQKLLVTYLESYELENIIGIHTFEVLKRPGQTIGILIGLCFKMPVFWLYFLGELGGLLVYVGICFYALKLLPNKKELMCMIMLLPTALQQAGSFSYDSFNNALSFLLIAYIIYLYSKKEYVTLKDVIFVFSIGLLLLYIKTIYAGLLLLVAIVPIEKYNIKIGKIHIDKQWIKSNLKKTILGGIIGIILFVCILLITKYEYVVFLYQTITNIDEVCRLMIRSFIEEGRTYIKMMIAYFGWVDTPVGQWFIIFYFLITSWICLSCGRNGQIEKKDKLNHKSEIIERGVVILTTIFMLFMIMFSMLGWGFQVRAINENTPFGSKLRLLSIINGIQGRYFIPILPLLLFISTKNKYIVRSQKRVLVYTLTQIITSIYIIYILLFRYWI